MFIAIVGLVGLGCILFGVWRMIQWKRMQGAYRRWPSVKGEIVSSSLRTSTRLDDDNTEYEVWLPVVAYRYAVDGKQHEGAGAFWFDHEFMRPEDAESWLASVPPGSATPVFYNPANPGKSALVLNEPTSAPGLAPIGLGIALLLGAVFGPALQQ